MMRKNKFFLMKIKTLALFCTLTLLIACGGSENTTPSAQRSNGTESGSSVKPEDSKKVPDVDACSLVTRSEADAIMGKLREAPKPATTLRDEKACSYLNEEGANVTVRVYGSNQFGLQKGIDSEEKMTSLPGLGDEAYYTKKGSDTDLWVRKGGATLNVNGSIGLEKSKGMAQKALSRL